jgi:glycosyltransferase involved in cell wall biosynthesis
LGRRQLNVLKKDTIATFTGSKFNLEELKKHHFHRPQLLPLLDIPKDLKEIKKEKPTSKKGAPKNILFVGCLTPHKNQHQLIKAFYYLKKTLPKHSKLFLVGSPDPIFLEYLNLLIRQLGLSLEVKLTGRVTRKTLEQHYEMADAFVCMSKHEGFCIPLVEAMSRQVPVFYLTTPGVKETMGNSGVALHTEDPFEIAQIIYTVLESPKALSAILRSQHRRLIELGKEHNVERLQEVLLELVKQIRNTPNFQINRLGAGHFMTA